MEYFHKKMKISALFAKETFGTFAQLNIIVSMRF